MEFFSNFPAFSILLSLLCAVITYVLKEKPAKILSCCLIVVCMIFSGCTLYYTWLINDSFIYMMGHFPAPWGNEIRAGILEPLIAFVFDAVLLLCILGGQKHLKLDIEPTKLNLYYVMIALLNAALMALIYTNDIFTAYVFIEICTIASCVLLMIRQIGRTTIAATRYMVFSLLGSGLFLIGIIMLYNVTGHLLMEDIYDQIQMLWANGQYRIPLLVVISLIVAGIAIKSGLFPFHFWMPDTYGYSTPTSAGILSGLVSKAYIFLLIKIIYRVIGIEVFYESGIQNVLFIFGICGMLFGSFSAMRENDINRMTAFSSAAQIGYIYMGIGLDPVNGIVASVFHIIMHAVTKPALFLSASGLIDASGGSRKFSDLQGSAHRNRVAGVAFTVGAISMVGLPGLMGFVSKLLFANAAVAVEGSSKTLITLIALAISTLLNTYYFLRTVIRIYTIPEKDKGYKRENKRNSLYAFVSICFIFLNLSIGMQSQPIVTLIRKGLELL